MQKKQQVQQFKHQLAQLQQLLIKLARAGQLAAIRRCDQQVSLVVMQITQAGLQQELAASLDAIKAEYMLLLQQLTQQQAELAQRIQASQQQIQAVSAYQFTKDATQK